MADFHTETQLDGHILGKASSNNGKSDALVASAGISPLCPQCGCFKVWRDGLRYSMFGDKIQRWLCRNCGLRFSDIEDVQKAWSTFERVERIHTKPLRVLKWKSNRQISADLKEGKNLAIVEPGKAAQREGTSAQTPDQATVKGKIVEYAFKMQKEGYAELTTKNWVRWLKHLTKIGANLMEPESVKGVSEAAKVDGQLQDALSIRL